MKFPRAATLFIGDILCFIAGFWVFVSIVHPLRVEQSVRLHTLPFALLIVLWLGIFFIFNFYDIQKSKPNVVFLRNYGLAALVMLGIGFIFFYIVPRLHITPKTNLVIFEGVSLVLILIWRRLFYLATRNSFHTRFAIVCAEEKFHTLVSEIEKSPELGYVSRGTFSTLADFLSSNIEVDTLIVHNTNNKETELLEKILASHIEVIDLPEAYEQILYKIPVDFIDNAWIIRSVTKNINAVYEISLRSLSIIIAIFITIFTLPITLIVALIIKLEDRGPIFYKQKRVGLNGVVFNLYKFRSMTVNAESHGAQWADHKDPRVTRIGSIIRKLHIDEIPQMINVLRNNITLVGPRPERPEFVAELEKQIPYYFMRHAIRPGFTGWAQIKFRYARSIMDSKEKFEYDLYYFKNRNLFLDFGIILKTVQIIFTH